MERVFASGRSVTAASVVTATALLALCCCAGRCTAAARPLGPHKVATAPESSALTLPPSAAVQRSSAAASGYGDGAARAGKWLPFAGADGGGFVAHRRHLPPAAFWAHKPMPWVGGAHGGSSGAFEGGGRGEEEVVRDEPERERSYERGESDTTRQEQLAMWASLLNPKGKRREASGWPPAAEVEDDPAGGGVQVSQSQTMSGFDWRNNGN